MSSYTHLSFRDKHMVPGDGLHGLAARDVLHLGGQPRNTGVEAVVEVTIQIPPAPPHQIFTKNPKPRD